MGGKISAFDALGGQMSGADSWYRRQQDVERDRHQRRMMEMQMDMEANHCINNAKYPKTPQECFPAVNKTLLLIN